MPAHYSRSLRPRSFIRNLPSTPEICSSIGVVECPKQTHTEESAYSLPGYKPNSASAPLEDFPDDFASPFRAAFELGRHEWFALRRLITNSRSSAFTGSFLKETSQGDGRNKNWTMQRLLHRTLRFRCSPTGEQIQNGRMADEIPRDPITPWCGPPLFCPCFFLAETSVLKIS